MLKRKGFRSARQLNIVPMMWIYTIKAGGRKKARLVMIGNLEKDTYAVISSSPTLSREGTKLVLVAIVQHRWVAKSGDVPTAFLKQDEDLWDREVYAWPPPEVGCPPGTILRLKKAIYGLVGAPLQWYKIVRAWLQDHGFRRSDVDHSIFYLKGKDGSIQGILGLATDDLLWGGASWMHKVMGTFATDFRIGTWDNGFGDSGSAGLISSSNLIILLDVARISTSRISRTSRMRKFLNFRNFSQKV